MSDHSHAGCAQDLARALMRDSIDADATLETDAHTAQRGARLAAYQQPSCRGSRGARDD